MPFSRIPRRLAALWLLIALALILTLTACVQGTAREAEHGKRVDARRTSVMQSVQETYTANLIASTPPPPTATSAP